jgi:hypothetical protein
MPYSNIPKSKWGKMERCTSSVNARGDSKYAICYNSIMGTLKDRFKKGNKK